MDWVGWLRPLWEIILSWFRLFTGPPPPSEAVDGGVVTNMDIKSKKIRNLNAKVETESGSNSRPSEKENNAGQCPPARYTARGGGVIRNDKIRVDEIEGDVDLSVCTKKEK